VPPADLPVLVGSVLAPLARSIAESRISLYPTLGIAFLSGFVENAASAAAGITGARRAVEGLRGNLVVLDVRHGTFGDRVDPYGTLPTSFFLMQRLKERFDPARRLNPGRFLGGL
jgi:glycolate oxidase FAD binding subunit